MTRRVAGTCIAAAVISTGLLAASDGTSAAVPVPNCPQVAPERPLPSNAPLPIGMTVSDDSSANPNLIALRPPSGAPMQIHLYEFYPLDHPIIDQVIAYHNAGYRLLVTLRTAPLYPPPELFAAWVKQLITSYGKYMDAVEVTNEPNSITFGPSDGQGPNELSDLVAGVITAKATAKQLRLHMRVAFNYVFGYHLSEDSFWEQLKSLATQQFLDSIDFMGLHTYPNFFAADTTVDNTINSTEIDALRTGRCYMTYLGLAHSIPIDVDETGYPTPRGPLEYDAQADYWRRVLDEIYAYRANYNIEGVDVFAWSIPPWGINEVDTVPKPAYYVVKQRQAQYNPKALPSTPPTSQRSPSRSQRPSRCFRNSQRRSTTGSNHTQKCARHRVRHRRGQARRGRHRHRHARRHAT